MNSAEEWKRGWKLVLACFAGFSFFSITGASLGVFMEPVTRELGWSRTLMSAGMAISSVVTALLSPFVGIVIDRYGARRVALPGLVACALAISCFGLASGSATQWIALWVFYAVISISVKTTVWMAAVVGSFEREKGLALGVILCGTAATQMIIPPLATWLIDVVGWRIAYVWIGCAWGGLTFLLCYLFLFDAHDRKRRSTAVGGVERRASHDLYGVTISEAWRDLALWRIAISTLVMMTLTIGLLVHQIPILTATGVSRNNAAWLASLAGLSGIAGKLFSGFLLDRFAPNWVSGLTVALTALAFGLLLGDTPSLSIIIAAMVINGYAAGSSLQIASYLTARYAGLKHFGVIYGFLTSIVSIGSGTGPLLAGRVYDVTGQYTAFLIVGTIGCLLCGLLLLSLPRYPIWTVRGELKADLMLPKGPW